MGGAANSIDAINGGGGGGGTLDSVVQATPHAYSQFSPPSPPSPAVSDSALKRAASAADDGIDTFDSDHDAAQTSKRARLQ
jgi:hypothetical protein